MQYWCKNFLSFQSFTENRCEQWIWCESVCFPHVWIGFVNWCKIPGLTTNIQIPRICKAVQKPISVAVFFNISSYGMVLEYSPLLSWQMDTIYRRMYLMRKGSKLARVQLFQQVVFCHDCCKHAPTTTTTTTITTTNCSWKAGEAVLLPQHRNQSIFPLQPGPHAQCLMPSANYHWLASFELSLRGVSSRVIYYGTTTHQKSDCASRQNP